MDKIVIDGIEYKKIYGKYLDCKDCDLNVITCDVKYMDPNLIYKRLTDE